MRAANRPQAGELESGQLVREALADLTRNSPPISATGGWFPTMALVRMTGLNDLTIRERLTEMEDLGQVERRRVGSHLGGGGYVWRMVR